MKSKKSYEKNIFRLRVMIIAMFLITMVITVNFQYGFTEFFVNCATLIGMAFMIRYSKKYGMDPLNRNIEDLEFLTAKLQEMKLEWDGKAGSNAVEIFELGNLLKEEEVREQYENFEKSYYNQEIVECSISDYVNYEQLTEKLSLNFCNILPGIMTAVGILGTFVGLTIGLSGFDLSDTDTISTSIQTFVSGINVAFFTSIYGIVLSIFLNSFYNNLEERFEEKLIEVENLFDYFGMNRSKQAILVHLYKEQQKQTKSIEILTNEFTDKLAKSLADTLTASFDKTNVNIMNLMGDIKAKEASAIEDLTNMFLTGMNSRMTEEYKLMAETMKQLEDKFQMLAETVQELGVWQKELIGEIEEFINQIHTISQDMTKINQTTQTQISRFSDIMEGFHQSTTSVYENEERICNKLESVANIMRTTSESKELEELMKLVTEIKSQYRKNEMIPFELNRIDTKTQQLMAKLELANDKLEKIRSQNDQQPEVNDLYHIYSRLHFEIEQLQTDLEELIKSQTVKSKITRVFRAGGVNKNGKEKETKE
jgi:biopolymer transport protein ExbB/TolQ